MLTSIFFWKRGHCIFLLIHWCPITIFISLQFQLIWMSINVALFFSTYMNYGTTKKYTYLRKIIKVWWTYIRILQLTYSEIPIFQTSKGNRNLIEKSGCREIRDKIMRSLSREMTSELRNWEVGEIEGLRNWDSTVIIVLIFAINVYLFSNCLFYWQNFARDDMPVLNWASLTVDVVEYVELMLVSRIILSLVELCLPFCIV